MNTIYDEIKELEGIINSWEDTDPAYFTNELRNLRHNVLYVHSSIERGLEILMANHIVPLDKDPKSNNEAEEIFAKHIKIYEILSHISFSRKMSQAKSWGLITNIYFKMLETLNKIRNEFAHPDAYKIKRYNDPQIRKETLQTLVNTYEAFQAFIAK